MGLFNNWPYEDLHKLNLDWVTKTVRELSDEWARYHTDWENWKNDTDAAFNSLYNYVMEYFNNLDLDDEVRAALNNMVQDGTIATMVEPLVSSEVSTWLANNITPTTPAIDKSLTIAEAAADSEIVGDYILPMVSKTYNILATHWINANITNGEIVPITSGRNNFASEDYFEIPDGVSKIGLYGEANQGNTTIYIQSYDANKTFINYQSKKINLAPTVITLPEGTKFIRVNGYLAGGIAYKSIIPIDFMITIGSELKPYIRPWIISDDFNPYQIKNEYRLQPQFYHTHSTRQEYSLLYGATAINKKIFINFDKLKIIKPSNIDITLHIFDDAFDQISDRIYDSGWVSNPAVIDLSNYTGKYLRVIAKNHSGGSFNLENIDNVFMYAINTNIENANTAQSNTPVMVESSSVYKSIAHRGLQKISPECTAISYINANNDGFKIGENDLFISEDNILVMWHDPTLNKLRNLFDVNGYQMYLENDNIIYYNINDTKFYTYNDGVYTEYTPIDPVEAMVGSNYSVTDLPINILKRIDFGRYKGGEYEGQTILTFEEWVKLMRNLGMDMYLDRKITYTSEVLTEVVNILNKYGMQPYTYFVGGFTPTTVNTLYTIAPFIKGFVSLAKPTAENITNFKNAGYGHDKVIFMPDGKQLTSADALIIQNASALGYKTEAYYVDYTLAKPALIETLYNILNMGIIGITTDQLRMDQITRYNS